MSRQVTRTIEVTTTVTLERAELRKIIREAAGAPDNADVDINDFDETAAVTWKVVDHGDGA